VATGIDVDGFEALVAERVVAQLTGVWGGASGDEDHDGGVV
jgi:hypothetical protein